MKYNSSCKEDYLPRAIRKCYIDHFSLWAYSLKPNLPELTCQRDYTGSANNFLIATQRHSNEPGY